MNRDSIDFENGQVPVLFRRIVIPTLLGTLAQSAIALADGIFVGHGVGPQGVAAVNIIVPIFMIMSGIGLMLGIGCSVVTAIHLSQKNIKAARLNVTQALLASTLIVALICGVGMIAPNRLALLMGSSETLLQLTSEYVFYILPGFVFQMWSMIGLFIIRLDGSPKYAMWCNVIPAVLNIFLDWLLVMYFNMGIKGAAIATLTSLVMGGVMAIIYLLFCAEKLKLTRLKMSITSMKLSFRNISYQCKIGFPTLLGEMALAVLIFVGNLVFMNYLGDNGVGAFGVACFYVPLFYAVGNAVAQSAQPIISYDYGANRRARVVEARTLMLKTSAAIGLIVALLFAFAPYQLVSLFIDADCEAGKIAVEGFPYLACGVIFFIFNTAIIGYYQSVEQIRKSTFYVLLRGFILLIPIFILLPMLLGVKGIWLAMPLAELFTLAVILVRWRSKIK